MPKTQIFTVMLFIRECVFTIKHIIGDFKISFNMMREIQLWTSNQVKHITDFAQCQREFFVIKNMKFGNFFSII